MERQRSSFQTGYKLYLMSGGYIDRRKKLLQSGSYSAHENNNNKSEVINKNNFIKEEDLINEHLNLLQNLWDDLGFSFEYKKIFINNLFNIQKSGKIDIILQAKNNLRNIKDLLHDIKKEITIRENNLELLKKYNTSLENIFNKEELINNILEEIINIIQKLRKNAINIVTKMTKLNKIIHKYLNSKKIDINRLKQKFSYNPNYLNKMTLDLLFLKDSAISNYIEINNSKIDPFLTNCAPIKNQFNYSSKKTISIPVEQMKLIRDCRTFLLQESLFNNLLNSNNKNDVHINNYFEENNKINNYNLNLKNDISKCKNFKNRNKSSIMNNHNKKLINENGILHNKQINELKFIYGPKNYDALFKKSRNIPLNYSVKIGKNNYFKINQNFIIPQNKIKIEREEIGPLKSNEFIKQLNHIETDNSNNSQKNLDILNNRNNSNFNEEEINKYKNLSKIEEQNRINLEKDVNILQMKLKEISEKAREYEEEIKKINIKRKKKENELNIKIENLEKEKEKLEKLVFNENEIENENKNLDKNKNKNKNDNENKNKINNLLIEKIKYLEEQLKIEKNSRINKENEILNIKKQIKDDEEKRNQGKEEEENKNIFKGEKKNLIEEIKRQNNKIKEIEEEKIKLHNENTELKNSVNILKEDKNKMGNDYNKLKEEKNNLENNYNLLNINKNKLEKDNNALIEKISKLEKENKRLKDENKKLINIIKESTENITNINHNVKNYKIDYYRGKISNLINLIIDKVPLEKIPDFIKRVFLLNDSIYNEEYYFKGIFPKIIISTDEEDENNIKGLCSLYYESNENLTENLILRINSIYAIEDCETQIIKMINFIKDNLKFKRLEVYLLYDKIEDKYIPNKKAKDLFQKKLGFKWLCVVRDEKAKQRYINLYYNKEIESQENIEKEKNNFYMENLTIITINNEKNSDLLKNMYNNDLFNEKIYKPNYNKFINPYPIYSLIYENPRINGQYLNLSLKNELKEMKEKLWRFVIVENGWNTIEEEKKQIKKINIDIDNSAYKEIENYYNSKDIETFCDLYQNKISLNFENNYSIIIDDIYYNKISTNKIKILKETKTNSLFYLIPSNNNTVLFYISEANKKLKELLFENNRNIYDKFLEFQPSSQKEIIDFSVSSSRDIAYIPNNLITSIKTIYIPTFSINTHLFSYCFKDIEKNINMTDIGSNQAIHLNSVDEYINVSFKPDENIENSFSVIPVGDKKNNLIIKESFIIGIFDNDIINNTKLPLLQFLYITKDNFLKKDNYNPK